MSQPIQDVEVIVPLPQPLPTPTTPLETSTNRLKTPARVLAGVLLSPVLVLVAALGFLVVLADFTFFRLRDVRDGHPQPKGLWEF